MIEPGRLVLGGNAFGFVKRREELLLGSRVKPGDAILIAPAVGIHTNGLTLARDTIGKLPRGYETPLAGDPAGRSIGEALLDATPLYGVLLEALFDAGVDVHYAVNVTGHRVFRKFDAFRRTSFRTSFPRCPAVPPGLAMLAEAAQDEPDGGVRHLQHRRAGSLAFVRRGPSSVEKSACRRAARTAPSSCEPVPSRSGKRRRRARTREGHVRGRIASDIR
jgi:hypothetical protein